MVFFLWIILLYWHGRNLRILVRDRDYFCGLSAGKETWKLLLFGTAIGFLVIIGGEKLASLTTVPPTFRTIPILPLLSAFTIWFTMQAKAGYEADKTSDAKKAAGLCWSSTLAHLATLVINTSYWINRLTTGEIVP